MKSAFTALQMKKLDCWTIEEIGIPAICLMENAGRLVADEAVRLLRRKSGRITIVCGSGNNGGDGLVAARHLFNKGAEVAVLLAGDRARFSDEALINYLAVDKLRIPILRPDHKGMAFLARDVMIIDALFGLGLCREITGHFRDIITAINAATARVISVDIPSGLDATTGKVWGIAVKADLTVTLAHPKRGLYIGDGPKYAGRIKVVDIGIPDGHVNK
ncbi:MAG: NAD(P)H-hydrate epimerase [Candidatus Omnitrophica bacterium]|nr:NAD(P)H-hydrate epimerase [Candidatus Omnitrophota bacterium]